VVIKIAPTANIVSAVVEMWQDVLDFIGIISSATKITALILFAK